MKAHNVSTLEINREARRIFVAQWIDLGRLSVHCARDVLHVRGGLVKLPGSDSPLVSATMDAIYRKLVSIPGVRQVIMKLDNWNRDTVTGTWTSTTGESHAQRKPRLVRPDSDAGDMVYEVK